MNENESIKYNREIMIRKIRYRVVLFWALFFTGLLLTNIFIDDKNIKGVLIGAILSLLITTIYSLVDIYIKVFEDIDSQRIQFISEIVKIHDDYNKHFRKEFELIAKEQKIIMDKDNIDMWLKVLIHKEACSFNIYTYIERLWKFIYCESKNIYLVYSLTEEYKEIDKYIIEKFEWFESHKLLFQKKEVVMTDIIQYELLTIINEDIKNNTIEKARDIIHGNIKEVDSKDIEDFVESNRGVIFRLSGLCICNKIDRELNQLFTMDIVAHKKYTDELFFIPCIPITVMLAIGIFLFVLCK